jgi:hypothetical protein
LGDRAGEEAQAEEAMKAVIAILLMAAVLIGFILGISRWGQQR